MVDEDEDVNADDVADVAANDMVDEFVNGDGNMTEGLIKDTHAILVGGLSDAANDAADHDVGVEQRRKAPSGVSLSPWALNPPMPRFQYGKHQQRVEAHEKGDRIGMGMYESFRTLFFKMKERAKKEGD
ncbi:MAG: hypothetical protein Q9174_004992 [Haloplaca sp. 1 TL-2023]